MISDFWIPRFKFSFDFEASETIKEMGLQRPFYPGELREMVHSSNNESSIFQKSSRNHVLKLMRKGSKLLLQSVSASATKRKTCATYPAPSTFVADHLFMFMIREAAARTVFFAGAVLNPLIMS
jgi:serpin B